MHEPASMEPRRYRRGDSYMIALNDDLPQASMEPRRYRRGDDLPLPGIPTINVLQWSRDVTVAVTILITEKLNFQATLQWSRDVTVAVTQKAFDVFTRAMQASMEPRRYRRGDNVSASVAGLPVFVLQWSRDVTVAVTPR